MFEIQQRDVPEQVVFTEQRNLFVQEPPGLMGAAPGDEVCDAAFPLR